MLQHRRAYGCNAAVTPQEGTIVRWHRGYNTKSRTCCSQPSRGTLTGDAAAGILTLGKRLEDEHRLQSRLHQLLHGSKNQAAGILTMGKRTEEGLENRKVTGQCKQGTPSQHLYLTL
uniref:Hypocretin neuropeptide precursor n=1 Tax=Sphaeramia orbicularis TaxID=375764 RepID=A0A673BHF7_9TELE